MTRYIALLRAINVGGYRKIKMEDLREMFASMRFQNTATYIQSGNVVFDAPESEGEQLAGRIEKQIDETFGHDVPVLVRTVEEMRAILDRNPFDDKDGWMLYVTFLYDRPPGDKIRELEEQSGEIEKFRIEEREVYSFVDKQTDKKPNFTNGFIEKHFGMHATSRNLRTVNKILELAETAGRG